ncbi:alpha amylase family protein [Haoranjiania flava]|uniref:Family 10 glycosylhydrolase n=1 Tax=Haoranjiania flava TaxID=1856322 RepID=A0AAE3LKN7_9BACT|nr:alpha amylase family protein [Haoranjiania flava]MCU7694768.1 family 10 glycosylhydrolase [Haoranjiania flava]
MRKLNFIKTALLLAGIVFYSCAQKSKNIEYTFPDPPKTNDKKPRFIWIDAAANFNDFANSKENIARDLSLAKDAGFTDIVVDIRPTSGDILYKSAVEGAKQVEWLPAWVKGTYTKVQRTESWDYLQAFIDKGHALGLKVHAGFNTMVGGHGGVLGNQGLLYRDAGKKSWATSENLSTGIKNTMDNGSGTKFFNPVNEEVQTYLVNLLKDLAKYDLDGIFIDRGRFDGIQSDFSEITRQKFQAYLGSTVANFPGDILPPGATMTNVMAMSTYPQHFTKWLEFRAKVIYDFMAKARTAIKSVNAKVKFGVYVGGWYSTYYDVGVNWASPKYDPSATYKWATKDYRNYGYAALMDQMLIGAYASPLKVNGSTEWTMEGFAKLAKEKTRNDCPMVAAGPDVGNWDPDNKATAAEENQAIVNSVKACMDVCDGYFLFDMIHLKLANQWQFVKEGIQKATAQK